MFLVYLGESGTDSGDSGQRFYISVALLVHESQWVTMKEHFEALCRHYFHKLPGLPGTPAEINPGHLFGGEGFFHVGQKPAGFSYWKAWLTH